MTRTVVFCVDLIADPSLTKWFRQAVIQRLIDEHESGRANHGKKLWALLILVVWWKKYIET